MGAIDTLKRLFNRERIVEPLGIDKNGAAGGLDMMAAWYQSRVLLSPNRLKRYKDYRDMGEDPMISGALDLYADDATQPDPFRKALIWPQSRNRKVVEEIRRMLDEVEIDENAWRIARYTAQFGDNFVRPLINKEKGVVGLELLEAEQIERVIDKFGRLIGFKVSFMGDHLFKPWEFVHYRVIGSSHPMNEGGTVYGTSLLEAARRPYRQLRMLEDCIVIYRLEIGGRHRVFYVDVTGLSYHQGINEVKKIQDSFGTREYFNPDTKEFSAKFEPLYLSNDLFWPVRKDSQSRVDYLGVDPNVTGVADLEFIRYNLHAALKAPRAFLGGDEYQSAKYGLCLTGDTMVPSLDGHQYRLDDVVEKVSRGEEVWLMSCKPNGRLVPGRVKAGLCTGSRDDMLEVVLDNGETVKCTSNHPFMMRDGTYCPAGDLQVGDSLMPYYSRMFGKGGYYFAKDNQSEKWRALHTIVDEHLHGPLPPGKTVHHNAKNEAVGFNRWDNRPGSLLRLTVEDHHRLHREETVRRNKSLEHRALMSRLASEGQTGFGRLWRKDRDGMLERVRSALQKAQLASGRSSAHSAASRRVGRLYGRDNLVRFLTDDRYAAERAQAKRRGGVTRRRDVPIDSIIKLLVEDGVRVKKHVYELLGTSQPAVDRAVAKYMGCPTDWVGFLEHLGLEPVHGSARRGASARLRTTAAAAEFNHKVVEVRRIAPALVYDIEMEEEPNFALSSGVFVHNSQIYIVFSRLTKRLQRSQTNGYTRMAQIHLALRDIDPTLPANQFKMVMMQPSSLDQEQRLEALELATELAVKVKQAGDLIGIDGERVKRQAEMIFLGLTPYDMAMLGQDTDADEPAGGDLHEAIRHALSEDPGLGGMFRAFQLRYGIEAEPDRFVGERGDEIFPSREGINEIEVASLREEYADWLAAEQARAVDSGSANYMVEIDEPTLNALVPHLRRARSKGGHAEIIARPGPAEAGQSLVQ